VLPVSHHDRIPRIQALHGQKVGDQLPLVHPGPVQLAAMDSIEEGGKLEVIQDALGVDAGLGGRHEGSVTLAPQIGEQVRNPGIEGVLIETDRGEPFPVPFDSEAQERGILRLKEPGEGRLQGRSDAPEQVVFGGRNPPQCLQRMLDAARDADSGIGEGSIEIEENRSLPHAPPLE